MPLSMQGKELLKHFKDLPEHQQTKILVDAYTQIATLHQAGKSFDSFTWRDCRLVSDELRINADIDNYFNEESLQRNLIDYAGVIYCLVTGRTSAESMSWDAGRKIQSAVLREIVLTICGRNNSVNPLIEKLRQPYKDEDTFFEGYSTVDEKEAADAYKKQQEIEQENRKAEHNERVTELFSQGSNYTSTIKPWYTKWWYFLLLFLIIGGVRACKYSKNVGRQNASYQQQMIYEQNRQLRHEIKDVTIDLNKQLRHNSKSGSNGTDNRED